MRALMIRPLGYSLAVLSLAVLPSALRAQLFGPPDTTTGPPRGTSAISFGVQAMEVDAFNVLLRANGFPTMNQSSVVSGLTSSIRVGRWDLAFTGGAIMGGHDESASWRTELSGQAILVGVGFALVDAGRWRVVPNGGVGLTRVGFHVEERRGGSVDSALADPLRGTDLSGQTAVWHAGLVDYKLGKWSGQKVGLGLRVGYAKLLGDTDWRADDNDLSDGPKAGVGGPYARLGFSFALPKRRDAILTTVASLIPWISR
jgi:hypothetical protein